MLPSFEVVSVMGLSVFAGLGPSVPEVGLWHEHHLLYPLDRLGPGLSGWYKSAL